MLEVTTTGWIVTTGVILGLLAIDLALATLRPHEIGFREATVWSVFYIAVAMVFGIVFASVAGWDYGSQYFAGYIVEKSLSVDNLFVFVVIMNTFAVPPEHRQRALIIGIVLALILRIIFIALGATLLAYFSWMFLVFGLVLIGTAIQLYRHRNVDPSPEDNALVRFMQKRLPITTEFHEGKLVTRVKGRATFTPLFVALVAIGSTDIIFALDSIPAVFGVTQETYIVLTANAFALLGLRALFFLVTGLLDRLVYLSTGLALILAFIGVKLCLYWGHKQYESVPEISTPVSLIVIGGILAVTTVASLIKTRRDPTARAHAGTLRDPDRRTKEGGRKLAK